MRLCGPDALLCHFLSVIGCGSALLCGASAGSLTAVLGACDVDMSEAAEAALGMSLRIGLWKRPLGLAGVWGGLVEKWLHDLLPTDAATRCNDRVSTDTHSTTDGGMDMIHDIHSALGAGRR